MERRAIRRFIGASSLVLGSWLVASALSGAVNNPPPTASATTFGLVKCSDASVTCPGGVPVAVGGVGTVTTTGSPTSGNLTKFSGGTSITNGDLSGDCTTVGALAITCTKTSGVAFATSATTDTTNASNISSGTLGAARLPNPSATTLGGIESFAVVSHQFLTSISISGVPAAAQPACADLSNAAASCSTDATNATNIASGTLGAGRLPAFGSGDVSFASGGGAGTIAAGAVSLAKMANLAANSIIGNNTGSAATPLALTTGQTKTLLAIACADLTNEAASCATDTTNAANISSGLLALARGGANADLSATGGTSQVLKQTSSGGAITVARLACSDLSNAAASCSTDTTVATNITSGTLPTAQVPAAAATQKNVTSTVTAPTSTSVFTMAGLAGTVTPTRSGKVLITISGYIIDASNVVANVGIIYQIAHNTGTAPTSNAAVTGTVDGVAGEWTAPTAPTAAADVHVPFSISAVVTGLALNTAVWIDLQQKAITTASQYEFGQVSISAIEL